MTNVNPDDMQAIISLFDASTWTEMHLAADGFELHLSKDGKKRYSHGSAPHTTLVTPMPEPSLSAQLPDDTARRAATSAPASANEIHIPDGSSVVRAPNLGTFYRSPKPGAPHYIEIGQQVEADTDVCLIEVMKLFTPVKAGVAGTIVEVLVDDGELVEFDQPLFAIRTNES